MKCSSVLGSAFVVAVLAAAAGCVGDDPESSGQTPTLGPDASTSAEGGGPGPGTNDAGGTDASDAGVDAAPPACSTIQVSTLSGGAAAGAMNGAGNVATFNAPEGITVNPSNGDVYELYLVRVA